MAYRNILFFSAGIALVANAAIAQPYGPPPDRDRYCRHEAAASTGYVTPGEAASREQTNGTFGGLLAGGALGAIIGGAAGNAGAGAAIGAGTGLVAGSAIGSENARQAARDVRHDYDQAYYACMDQTQGGPPPRYDDRPPAPPPDDYQPRPPDDRYPR